MKEITQENIDRYVGSPQHCPFCESDQIEGGDREIEDGVATQDVHCHNCTAMWSDVYRMVGISYQDESGERVSPRASFLHEDYKLIELSKPVLCETNVCVHHTEETATARVYFNGDGSFYCPVCDFALWIDEDEEDESDETSL